MRGKLGIDDKSEESDTSGASVVAAPEEQEEASKRDRGTVAMLRKIRNKFIERRLVGSISISISHGIKTSIVDCDVNAESALSAEEAGEESETFKSGISGVDGALNLLERGANTTWAGVDFIDDITLTTDLSFGLSFGPLGMSVAISLSATAPSLVAAYRRRNP